MADAHIRCPVDRIKTMNHVATADMTAGEVALVNGRVSVAYESVSNGDAVQLVYAADDVDMPKAAVAIDAGDALYWDNGNGNVTTSASGNTKCGMARKAAASGDAVVGIELINAI